MAKRQDDNLENFFLNRVNEYKIDYREEDWLKLNELLDASDAMKFAAFRQRVIWMGSGTLLIISILLLLWMSRNLNSRNINEVPVTDQTVVAQNSILEKPTNQEAALSSIDQNLVLEEGTSQEPESMGIEQNRAKSNTEHTEDTEIYTEDNNTIRVTESAKDRVSKAIESKDLFKSSSESEIVNYITDNGNETQNRQDAFLLDQGNQEVTNDKLAHVVSTDNTIDEAGTDLSESFSITPYGWNLDYQKSPVMVLSAQSANKSGRIELRKQYSWNFSLAADYSAVGVSDFDGPALRLGISFEYYISPRFSVLTGVNYSQKTYSAFGREYTPPYGFWTRGVVPDETYGECNVLDIPINISYYIPNAKGQALFVRAGLSSWLMLEEHYYYEYESNDPDLVKYWGGENENYHYFSIINLSAGFEHPLSNRFSILAEPYLNIPLGGVGYGAVDLYSTGLKLSMKVNHYGLINK